MTSEVNNGKDTEPNPKPIVGVVMGSDSDLRVMQEAAKVLGELHVPCRVDIVSAHRTPDDLDEYARKAEPRGLKVIVAGAGGSAHLPGMIASQTIVPVISVPIISEKLGGLDALLSQVQMPPGIPVGVVGLDNAKNAGLLAAQIVAVEDKALARRLKAYRRRMNREVKEKDAKLQRLGFRRYLKGLS